MDDLIERLKKAQGPDRALDVDIVYMLFPEIGAYQPHCVGEEPIFWEEPYRKQPCPKFTESIDAALTLVPGDMNGSIAFGKHSGAIMWKRDPRQHLGEHRGATPAIALCIAALKAWQSTKRRAS